MYYIELIKRIVPFFLTFTVGLIVTGLILSIFAFVSPSNTEVRELRFEKQTIEREDYNYRKRVNCWKWKKMKRMKKKKDRELNLEYPPPPAPPKPPAPPEAPAAPVG